MPLKIYPECGWHHPIDWEPGMDIKEKLRNLSTNIHISLLPYCMCGMILLPFIPDAIAPLLCWTISLKTMSLSKFILKLLCQLFLHSNEKSNSRVIIRNSFEYLGIGFV